MIELFWLFIGAGLVTRDIRLSFICTLFAALFLATEVFL